MQENRMKILKTRSSYKN